MYSHSWAASLLIVFDGVTDRLISLFVVGAFMAFTLSQASMVVHWRRKAGRGAFSSMLINGVGALATGLTTGVVIVAKFTEGAWITVLAIPRAEPVNVCSSQLLPENGP